jgi:hypothetical protein
MNENSANDFLMGGGIPAAKFPNIGDTIIGLVLKPPKLLQVTDPDSGEVKRWQSGDPQMQVVIEVQTELRDSQDDNGVRTIWAKGVMKNAIRDAVRAAGAKGVEPGGLIQVTFSGEEPPRKRGLKPMKLYTAAYQPPSQSVEIPADPVDVRAPIQQAVQRPAQTAATPAPQVDLAATQASFLDRLKAQAQRNVNAQGQPQDIDPPF